MPSLVYITRIQPPSAEAARFLESSGFHVQSFGPGEITADECVLVMTSEAVLAGLQLAAITGAEARLDKQSLGAPSLQDIQKHLGSDREIWNRIKAAGVVESAAEPLTVASDLPASSIPAMSTVGFLASQAGERVLAASSQKAAAPASQSLPSAQKLPAGIHDASAVPQIPPRSMAKVIREAVRIPALSFHKARSAAFPRTAQSQQLFWQPVVLAAALLLFAVVLLAGRPSTLSSAAEVAAVDKSGPGAHSGSKVASEVRRRSSRTQLAQPLNHKDDSAQPPDLATESQHRISDYDFVAEDYTTRFDLHGRAVQSPNLRRGAQSRVITKRVVVD